MKKTFIIGVSFLFCGLSSLHAGKRVPTRVWPKVAGVVYEAKSANFDGSVSFENPRVLYRGSYRKVYAYSNPTGLCVIFGYRKPVLALAEKRTNPAIAYNEWGTAVYATEAMAIVSWNGQMGGLTESATYVDAITCQ